MQRGGGALWSTYYTSSLQVRRADDARRRKRMERRGEEREGKDRESDFQRDNEPLNDG